VPRLAEQMARPSCDHFFAEADERGDDFAKGQQLGTAAVQRQHIDAKTRLQCRVTVELVENDVGLGIPLQFNDDAQTFAVASSRRSEMPSISFARTVSAMRSISFALLP